MNRENTEASRTDHAGMMRQLAELEAAYPFFRMHTLGYSCGGRGIPMIRLGEESARRTVVYVGAHHGMEWITADILLRFLTEYCEALHRKQPLYSINPSYLFRTRMLCIIPMLNPDGVQLQQYGIGGFPNAERLIAMNHGSTDFSRWQANGRGVDLNHNYNAGFAEYKVLERNSGILGGAPTRYSGEYPESEPESRALASYLRLDPTVGMILTLHTQGEEIYCTSGGQCPPRGREMAHRLAELSGYSVSEAVGMASYGGLTDWAIRELRCPSFTVECGRGVNPLPASDAFAIYRQLREMLFTAPLLA